MASIFIKQSPHATSKESLRSNKRVGFKDDIPGYNEARAAEIKHTYNNDASQKLSVALSVIISEMDKSLILPPLGRSM
jgi:hypothetical protein